MIKMQDNTEKQNFTFPWKLNFTQHTRRKYSQRTVE